MNMEKEDSQGAALQGLSLCKRGEGVAGGALEFPQDKKVKKKKVGGQAEAAATGCELLDKREAFFQWGDDFIAKEH